MGTLAGAALYVLFVWWFSTGAILLLVGVSQRHNLLLKGGTALAFAASVAGLLASSADQSVAGAYCAFTCAILLWGTIEASLLAGWITGPRPEACPKSCSGADRVWYALQAIAYHELMLIAAAGLVFALTSGMPNRLGLWTFLALLVLRQSAKINLFLGVRTLNDELLPVQVGFLKSYFTQKPMNLFFPLSVTLATGFAACLAVSAVTSEAPFNEISLALLAVLVSLGALEHWFMVLPVSVTDLWRWSVRRGPVAPVLATVAADPVLSIMPGCVPEAITPKKSAACAARQRLENEFRQSYRERQARGLAATIAPQLAEFGAGTARIVTDTSFTADGRAT